MRQLLLSIITLVSISNASALTYTPKPVDFYQDISCTEMTNLQSEDEFIRFAAKEITTDLGTDVCSRVQSLESLYNDEEASPGEISAVQFGKLIESIHSFYTSEF